MYTLDTNVLIYHLHDERTVRDFVDELAQRQSPTYISVLTITELLRFAKLSPNEESAIAELLTIFSAISIDSQIARAAGGLGRQYGLKLADSIIAATALFTGTALVTRNVRDFKRVLSLVVKKI